MSDPLLTVLHSNLAESQLDIVAAFAGMAASGIARAVTLVDYLGRPATIDSFSQVETAPNLLRIAATVPPIDPDADAPSYKLTIGGESTWFAPVTPGAVATSAGESSPPPGSASIDYLARDFTSLVAMMRSRVSQIVGEDSEWALEHPADPMTTLIELLAYSGDHLAYRQDAAGTESYLATARHRLSLRRHARLRDYAVNDGCNARTALAFAVTGSGVLQAGLQVVTLQPGEPGIALPAGAPLVASTTLFETMDALKVSAQLNDLGPSLAQSAAYTMAKGAVSLTLAGTDPGLVPGQLLVLRQLNPPSANASPFGAQVLRLLKVEKETSSTGAVSTMIGWHPEDALKADLTIPPKNAQGAVSLYANVVLADHGRSATAPLLPSAVPDGGGYAPMAQVEDLVLAAPPPSIAAAFNGSQDIATASQMVESAASSLVPDPRRAVPCVTVCGVRPGMPDDAKTKVPGVSDVWRAARDLLSASSSERAFAAVADDGVAAGVPRLRLRFAAETLGYAPAPGTLCTAVARTGDGQSGRVRANSLVQVIGSAPLVSWVTNPLPASPSLAEDDEAIRLFATSAYRSNMRGIDPDDWERLARADPLVTEIKAMLGPDGKPPCTIGLATAAPQQLTYELAYSRLMDFAVLGAEPTILPAGDVNIEIAMVVYCVSGANIGTVRHRLQQRIGAGALPDGSPAYANPVNWPLGRSVSLDELVGEIEGDPSVAFVVFDPSVDPRVLFRTVAGGDDDAANVARGSIPVSADKRARFGNDVSTPGRGGVRLFLATTS